MDVAIHQIIEVKGSEKKVITGCRKDIKVNRGARMPDAVTFDGIVTCQDCLAAGHGRRADGGYGNKPAPTSDEES